MSRNLQALTLLADDERVVRHRALAQALRDKVAAENLTVAATPTSPPIRRATSPAVTAVTQGANGAVVVNADNSVTYTPNADFNGTDSYTYTVTSGGVTETATVNVTVTPVNDDPAAADDAATTLEDQAVVISVLANDSDLDGDTVSVSSVTDGANGTVAINGDGTVTYTPNANFNGSDSFSYTLSDGHGGSDEELRAQIRRGIVERHRTIGIVAHVLASESNTSTSAPWAAAEPPNR